MNLPSSPARYSFQVRTHTHALCLLPLFALASKTISSFLSGTVVEVYTSVVFLVFTRVLAVHGGRQVTDFRCSAMGLKCGAPGGAGVSCTTLATENSAGDGHQLLFHRSCAVADSRRLSRTSTRLLPPLRPRAAVRLESRCQRSIVLGVVSRTAVDSAAWCISSHRCGRARPLTVLAVLI